MTSFDTACRITEIYSRTLFELALEQQTVETVKNDMDVLDDLAKTGEQFLGVMVSPFFSSEQKLTLMLKVFSGRLNDLTVNFLAAAIHHNRMVLLPQIITEYIGLYKKHHNYLDIQITVSQPMVQDKIQALETLLSEIIASNKIILKILVDPLIMGGIIIRYNDMIIDNSVRRRLRGAVETIINRGSHQESVYET